MIKGENFRDRHIGPNEHEIKDMLSLTGAASLDALTEQVVPSDIRLNHTLNIPPALTEREYLALINEKAGKNRVFRNHIGQGYYGTFTPSPILRNIFESPYWYTAYTPYQAEISQGRMESLLNFQTMVADLTALPIANASMLDEATAAAEAMNMCHASNPERKVFFVSDNVHPQTIAVVKTRAKWLGLTVKEARELGPDEAEVSFVARYRIGGASAVRMQERSRFVRENGRWYYVAGELVGK